MDWINKIVNIVHNIFDLFPDLSVTNNIKREVTLSVIANANCASIYGSSTVVSSTLCTSGAQGRAICDGDSGGPLVVVSGGNRVLVKQLRL